MIKKSQARRFPGLRWAVSPRRRRKKKKKEVKKSDLLFKWVFFANYYCRGKAASITYLYVCVCARACVRVRARARGRVNAHACL